MLCITANSGYPCPPWVKSGHWGTSNQCPLYPQKRTSELSRAMSALCQKQTFGTATNLCAFFSSGIGFGYRRKRTFNHDPLIDRLDNQPVKKGVSHFPGGFAAKAEPRRHMRPRVSCHSFSVSCNCPMARAIVTKSYFENLSAISV